jgi:molybdopterin-guanine dinucleotide biosynthesis protein A
MVGNAMKSGCSGVILAGGQNKRFDGQEKAFFHIGQHRIIDYIYRAFRRLFQEIIIVTNTPQAYLEFDVVLATDIVTERSSLTGIHTGLFYASHPFVFVAACDTPFINPSLIQFLLEQHAPGVDVVVPQTADGIEPMCAIYSRNCLKPIEDQLQQRRYKIDAFYRQVRVKRIAEAELRRHDPELRSFFNVNAPDDLVTALTMLSSPKE